MPSWKERLVEGKAAEKRVLGKKSPSETVLRTFFMFMEKQRSGRIYTKLLGWLSWGEGCGERLDSGGEWVTFPGYFTGICIVWSFKNKQPHITCAKFSKSLQDTTTTQPCGTSMCHPWVIHVKQNTDEQWMHSMLKQHSWNVWEKTREEVPQLPLGRGEIKWEKSHKAQWGPHSHSRDGNYHTHYYRHQMIWPSPLGPPLKLPWGGGKHMEQATILPQDFSWYK